MERRRVIALGFFDGVHKGHEALLSLCVRRAGELGVIPAAFTLDAHPSALLKRAPVLLLSTPADRAGLMRRCGIRDVIVGRYDERMMKTPWREFVVDYLVREQCAVHLVAGHDFRFGYQGEGNPRRLLSLCAELGIGCDIVPRVEEDGVTVSSTYIRDLIARGEMERAVRFLGHPHVLTGVVRHGKRLGSALGFPTANLSVPDQVLPPAFGVYAARVVSENSGSRIAVTNVGVRPTVDDGGDVTVESWLLDFKGDLYGQEIRVEFYARLRPEEKFDTLEELRNQVMTDAQRVRRYFAKHPV